MDRCDVLIVGGGPAGSTCAWKLKQAGLDVLVMDKQTFPRDKVCAGWITPAVVETLQIDTADYAQSRVFQPITGFNTGLIDGNEVSTHYQEIVSYGIRRREFDDYLLQRAGARLMLDNAFQSAQRDGDEWIINGNIRTPLMIIHSDNDFRVPISDGEQLFAAIDKVEAATAAAFKRRWRGNWVPNWGVPSRWWPPRKSNFSWMKTRWPNARSLAKSLSCTSAGTSRAMAGYSARGITSISAWAGKTTAA